MAIPFSQQSVGVVVVECVDTLQAPLICIEEGRIILRPFSVMIERIEFVHDQIQVKTSCIPAPDSSYSPGIREAGRLDVIFSFPIPNLGPEWLSDEDIKHNIRHALHEVMKHEIDECLRNWDGSHVNDPHGQDR